MEPMRSSGISEGRPAKVVTSRKRVLRGRRATHGRPWLRGVDSECVCRVMEPREGIVAGADFFLMIGGNIGVH
jgi:hypothetical protein